MTNNLSLDLVAICKLVTFGVKAKQISDNKYLVFSKHNETFYL